LIHEQKKIERWTAYQNIPQNLRCKTSNRPILNFYPYYNTQSVSTQRNY